MLKFNARYGLTERQLRLSRYWKWFKAMNYAHRRYSWDGLLLDSNDLEQYRYERAEYVPPGYVGVGGAGTTPRLAQRRPTAPYRIPMAVVNRFTSLLFAGRGVPHVKHAYSQDLSEFIEQLVVDTGLWSHMRAVRNFGGAQGSAVSSWYFSDGELVLEALDPRWCTPVWVGHGVGRRVASLRIEYQFAQDVHNADNSISHNVPHLYRRDIDHLKDITYKPVRIDVDVEPAFVPDPSKSFTHRFGICPVVWTRNTETTDDIDGDPDCYGTYEMIELIDMLLSQGARGAVASSDPTAIVFTDETDPIKFASGSGSAMQFPSDSRVQLMELNGSGPKTAYELADELRRIVLETVRCVLDDPSIGDRATTAEVTRTTSAMHDRAAEFRDQYGDHVRRLLAGLIQSVVATHGSVVLDSRGVPRRNALGATEIARVSSGMEPARFDALVRSLQDEAQQLTRSQIVITWPLFKEPVADDVTKGVASASAAFNGGFIEHVDAVRYIAGLLQIRDPERLVAALSGDAAPQAAAKRAETPPPLPTDDTNPADSEVKEP